MQALKLKRYGFLLSLVLGLGMTCALLWVLAPRSGVEAQVGVNPGFTVDLTYDAVWGLVGPGDTVTVTGSGGAAYGAAEADGVGFFWTYMWQSNGQPADAAGGQTIDIYVNGTLSGTITPDTITGQVDVLNDRVVGTIQGAGAGVPLTATLGMYGWAVEHTLPQTTTTTGSGGAFTVAFPGGDLGPHNFVRVEYVAGSHTVQGYLYPDQVFLVDSAPAPGVVPTRMDVYQSVFGFATPGQPVTATVIHGTAMTPATASANRPHGDYRVNLEIEPGDVVSVELGGGTVITTMVPASFVAYPDPALDRVTGTCPPNETVRVLARGVIRLYQETAAVADPSGQYTATFSSHDLKNGDDVYVAFADDAGNEVNLYALPPVVGALIFPWSTEVMGGVDGPGLPVTVSMDTGTDVFTTTTASDLGNQVRLSNWPPERLEPGHVITVESPSWTGVMTVAGASVTFDTAGERLLGEFDLPAGRVAVRYNRWNGHRYPLLAGTRISVTPVSPFTATFNGLDVQDGSSGYVVHYDANDFFSLIWAEAQWFQVEMPNGVSARPVSSGDRLTATLYERDGTPKRQVSEDTPEWWGGYWLDMQGQVAFGDWVTVTDGAGWTAGLQVPTLTVQADDVTDLIWGEGPKASVFVEHARPDWSNGYGGFVPVDGYVVDQAFIGRDVQHGDRAVATYQALSGDRVRQEYNWPWMRVNYAHDWVGGNYDAGHTFWFTVTNGTAATGTEVTTPGGGWNGYAGFETEDGEWFTGQRPDIQAGDTVHFEADDGYTNAIQVGTISGTLDVDNDVVSGTISAPWLGSVTLTVRCEVWAGPSPSIELEVPQGGDYLCDFAGSPDIQPGDDVAVMYYEPDGDAVINVFRQDVPDLDINKWAPNSDARPGGVVAYVVNYWNRDQGGAENVQIVDTLPVSTTYAGDTSDFPYTLGPGGVITWDLGELDPWEEGGFVVTLDVTDTMPTGSGMIAPNCIAITTTSADPNPGNNGSCADPVDVSTGNIDVSVDKWPDLSDPAPGEEFEYRIRTCNEEGTPAGPVWLTDTLPLSTTFVSWGSNFGDTTYWTAVVTTGDQVVFHAPGLPPVCEDLNLRLRLDEDVSVGTTLENTARIATAGDGNSTNDEDRNTEAQVGAPRYDVQLDKEVSGYVPVPDVGWVNYFVRYENHGNAAVHVWVTDTIPTGLIYQYANWGGGDQPNADQPLPPPTVVGDDRVWDLGVLPVGGDRWFHVQMDVGGSLSAGDTVTNCATIGMTHTESTPANNTSCYLFTLNEPGPNLQVTKESEWDGDGQLDYTIRFANIGTQTLNSVLITDTYPISTSPAGWPNVEYHRNVNITDNYTDSQWLFEVSEMAPGWSGRIYFDVDLDDPDGRPRWYTNTVEIEEAPGEAPALLADNSYTDVVVKGEVDRVDLWVAREGTNAWGQAQRDVPITITTALNQYVGSVDGGGNWSIDNLEAINPGDRLTVTAGAGLMPVVIDVPSPYTADASSMTDMVWGQIDALDREQVTVDLDGGPSQDVQTDGSGNYSATFSDVSRGGTGEVRYDTAFNYAEVGFRRGFQSPDLLVTVDYHDDWVNGNYEPGHTVWLTLTQADGSTIKATAVVSTAVIPHWGGQSGFEASGGDWTPQSPDIQPGDWVYGLLNSAVYTTVVEVGTITAEVDVDNEIVSGTISAPVSGPVEVSCEIHESGSPDSISVYGVDPDGGTFWCDFSPWDIQPGHNVAVNYREPDGDRVQTHPDNPAPNLRVEKWIPGGGETWPGGTIVYNVRVQNDGDGDGTGVVLTDTLPVSTTYNSDTSGFPAFDNTTVVTWSLDTLAAGSQTVFQLVLDVDSGATDGQIIGRNVMTVTAGNYEPPDWQGDNRAESETINVTLGSPDLYVNKNSGSPPPAPGQTFLYEIDYGTQNSLSTGPVLLTDTLPLSTTVVSWSSQNNYTGWTEVITTGGRFVLSTPALPGNWGDRLYLRLRLSDTVAYGTQLTNTVEITTTGDGNPGDNWAQHNNVWVESPRQDISVGKTFNWGRLVPGGEVSFNLSYYNQGNVAVHARMTDTLPGGTTFVTSTSSGSGQEPVTPAYVGDGVVAWDLGLVEPGAGAGVDLRLVLSSTLPVNVPITNCVTIGSAEGDIYPYNNTECIAEVVRPLGPNLRVHKPDPQWNGTGQIQYGIRVENIGSQPLETIVITDTYPVSTTWGGYWPGHWPQPMTFTHDAPNRRVRFEIGQLPVGETAHINCSVNLTGTIDGVQGLLFTNTLEAPMAGDVYTGDNDDQVVVYAGPDTFAEKWVEDGELRPGERVTFTVHFGNQSGWPGISGEWGSHLTETLPAEMMFITATQPGDISQPWTPEEISGTTTVRWSYNTLWSNWESHFQVVAEITDTVTAGQVMTNTVEVCDDNPNNVDRSPADALFELGLTILSPSCVDVDEVSFDHAPAEPVLGVPVTFTAVFTPSDATSPVDVTWNFGDGNVGSGQTVQHTYTTSGTHTVWVTATNDCSTQSYSQAVTVAPRQIFLPLVLRNVGASPEVKPPGLYLPPGSRTR